MCGKGLYRSGLLLITVEVYIINVVIFYPIALCYMQANIYIQYVLKLVSPSFCDVSMFSYHW